MTCLCRFPFMSLKYFFLFLIISSLKLAGEEELWFAGVVAHGLDNRLVVMVPGDVIDDFGDANGSGLWYCQQPRGVDFAHIQGERMYQYARTVPVGDVETELTRASVVRGADSDMFLLELIGRYECTKSPIVGTGDEGEKMEGIAIIMVSILISDSKDKGSGRVVKVIGSVPGVNRTTAQGQE